MSRSIDSVLGRFIVITYLLICYRHDVRFPYLDNFLIAVELVVPMILIRRYDEVSGADCI